MIEGVTKKERIAYELSWCETELVNIQHGLFSHYTEEYIKGAISALTFVKQLEEEKVSA